MKKESYRAELGYALHPDYHGKGIMQETMKEVLDYGFKIMKLHSVEANVNPENAASIKLLERNGLKETTSIVNMSSLPHFLIYFVSDSFSIFTIPIS